MEHELTDLARACVHCGLCLSHCPTYRVLREEADSPRGRILLMDALAAGTADAATVRPHLDRCIGCRGCESACPSGVPYGALLEKARARIGAPWRVRLFLKGVVARPWLLRTVMAAARLARRFPPRGRRVTWPAPPARPRARVGLHVGCVTPLLFPALAGEAAHVLTRLGYEVVRPRGQTCCGALHRHAGLDDAALRARNDAAFAGLDMVVSPAAGCSATPGLRDVCELLLEEDAFPGARLPPVKVAYDAPCHLLHGRGIDAGPLLDRIEGVERVPLPDAEQCCGAGGLYMELQAGLAREVRARKLDAIAASGARIVATPNPGCLAWLFRGGKERSLAVEFLHPVSLVARAMGVGIH